MSKHCAECSRILFRYRTLFSSGAPRRVDFGWNVREKSVCPVSADRGGFGQRPQRHGCCVCTTRAGIEVRNARRRNREVQTVNWVAIPPRDPIDASNRTKHQTCVCTRRNTLINPHSQKELRRRSSVSIRKKTSAFSIDNIKYLHATYPRDSVAAAFFLRACVFVCHRQNICILGERVTDVCVCMWLCTIHILYTI